MEMKNKILLSILIPTYNRVNYLMKNLSILFQQMEPQIRDSVEILVSDNCSIDETLKQLNSLEKINMNFRFWSNERNIGPDANFLKLVREAKGKFLWLFGDDEFLLEDALKSTVNHLKEHEDFGLFHISNSKRKKVLVFTDKVKYMKKVNFSISFITAHIFNREKIDFSINYDAFCGNNLIQEYFYFQVMQNSKKNGIIKDKLFSSDRAENIGGYKLFEVFSTNQNNVLKYFENKGMDIRVRKNMNKMMCLDFFPNYIIQFRLNPQENKWICEDMAETLDRVLLEYWQYRMMCRPLIVMEIEEAKKLNKILNRTKKIMKLF